MLNILDYLCNILFDTFFVVISLFGFVIAFIVVGMIMQFSLATIINNQVLFIVLDTLNIAICSILGGLACYAMFRSYKDMMRIHRNEYQRNIKAVA